MDPIAFKIGIISIHWYGIMMALAFLFSLASCIWLGRKIGRDAAFMSDLITWIMVSSIFGARMTYVLANLQDFSSDPFSVFYIWKGGLIYYGGFAGAAVGILLFARAHGEKLLRLYDIVAVALPFSHAMGRVGCFLNGCCYGGFFGKGAHWGSMSRHPVQLYEAALNVALFFGLLWYYHRKKRDGSVVATYMLAYAVIRFFTEFVRGDERMVLDGLTVAQLVSVVVFAGGVAGWMWLLYRERTNPDSSTGCRKTAD